ncbi:MAG: hypothetical protein Q7V63_00210 [Gammaproteobacteria bacterium]|nr:hypothetical protein [Gammaproteobacteria bacterium]
MNGNTSNAVGLPSRVRWNAIFAGVFLATSIGALLNMFGLGVGLTNIDLDPNTLTVVSTGSVIWWVISGVVAMFIGGWATVRLSNIDNTTDSVLNALTTWSLATVLGLLFVGSTVGMVLSGTADLVGNGLSAASQAASQSAPAAQMLNNNVGGSLNQISSQAEQLIKEGTANIKKNGGSVAQVNQEFSQALGDWLNADNPQDQQKAQQQVSSLLSKYTNLSQAQADQKVQQWQQLYNDAKQKAADTAEQAGDVMGGVSLAGFGILLLGGIAAALGGVVGGRSKRF